MDKIAEYYYHKGVYEGLSRGRADALKILEESMKRKADPVIVIKQQEQREADLEKVVMIDNVIMNMTAEGYNDGYKTRPFYEEVLRRLNAREADGTKGHKANNQ